jgi:hypothetical protein
MHIDIKNGSELGNDSTVTGTTVSDAFNTIKNNVGPGVIGITIDGNGSVITTGLKGFIKVPFPCTIAAWTIMADQSGSAVIDVWKAAYASFPPTVANTIVNGHYPTLSGQSSNATDLSNWTTTTVAATEVIAFNVNSASTVTRITIELKVNKL